MRHLRPTVRVLCVGVDRPPADLDRILFLPGQHEMEIECAAWADAWDAANDPFDFVVMETHEPALDPQREGLMARFPASTTFLMVPCFNESDPAPKKVAPQSVTSEVVPAIVTVAS